MKTAIFTISNNPQMSTSSVDSTHEEAYMVKKLLKHDAAEQRRVYEMYFGKMIGIPMRYCKNREESYEILNEAFMKVFTSIEKYKETGKFSGWIAKIVFNTTIDYVRRKTSYNKKVVLDETPVISIQNDALSNLSIEEIYAKIQLLPDASRAVFSLFVIDGYSHKEIAERLEITEGTSKWHLSNARKKLQLLIKRN